MRVLVALGLLAAVFVFVPSGSAQVPVEAPGCAIDFMLAFDISGSSTSPLLNDGITGRGAILQETSRFLDQLGPFAQSGIVTTQPAVDPLDEDHAQARAFLNAQAASGDSELDSEISTANQEFFVRGSPASPDVIVILGDQYISVPHAVTVHNERNRPAVYTGFLALGHTLGYSPFAEWEAAAGNGGQAYYIDEASDLEGLYDELMAKYPSASYDPNVALSASFDAPEEGYHELSWTPASSAPNADECPVSYNLYRSDDGGPFQAVATGLTETSFTDGFLPCERHDWYVTVSLGNAEGAPTNIVSYVPPTLTKPVVDLAADSPTDGFHGLSWPAGPAGPEYCRWRYDVYRSDDLGAEQVVARDLEDNFYLDGYLPCLRYDWRVEVHRANARISSDIVTYVPVTGTVDLFMAERFVGTPYTDSGPYETYYDLSWQAASGLRDHCAEFDLQRGMPWKTILNADGSVRYHEDGPIPCAEYKWRLRAEYAWAPAGQSRFSPWDEVNNGDKDVPEAPVLSVRSVAETNAPGSPLFTRSHPELTWTRPADNNCPIQSYEVQRLALPGGSWTTIASFPPPGETYEDFEARDALSCFAYRVRAINDQGPGPWSNTEAWYQENILAAENAEVNAEACPSWWITNVGIVRSDVKDVRLGHDGRSMTVGFQPMIDPAAVPPLVTDPYWRGILNTGALAAEGVTPLPSGYVPNSIDFDEAGRVFIAGVTGVSRTDVWVGTPSGGVFATYGDPLTTDLEPIVRVGPDPAHRYVVGYTSFPSTVVSTFAAPGMTPVTVPGELTDFEIGWPIWPSDKFSIIALAGDDVVSIGVPSRTVSTWDSGFRASDLAVQWSTGDVHVVTDVDSASPKNPLGTGFDTGRLGDDDILWKRYGYTGTHLDSRFFGTCARDSSARVHVSDSGLLALGATVHGFIDPNALPAAEPLFCAHTPRGRSISSYHQPVGPSVESSDATGSDWYVGVIDLKTMKMVYGSFAGLPLQDSIRGIYVTDDGRLYAEGLLGMPSTPFSYSMPSYIHRTLAATHVAPEQFHKVMHFGRVVDPTCDPTQQSATCGTSCDPTVSTCYSIDVNCNAPTPPGSWPVIVDCSTRVCESSVLGTCATETVDLEAELLLVRACDYLSTSSALAVYGCVAVCSNGSFTCGDAMVCTNGWSHSCIRWFAAVDATSATARICSDAGADLLQMQVFAPAGTCVTMP